MNERDIEHLRVDYGVGGDPLELTQHSAGADPMALAVRWLEQAMLDADRAAGAGEPNAMALATCDAAGRPSVRMVLCRGIDETRGSFRCFTNLGSRKAAEIAATGHAAITFWWPELRRQLRASGRIERVARSIDRAYFASRPLDSRIASTISNQSRPIASRAELERRFDAVRAEVAGGGGADALDVPDDWGGLDLIADEIEFWHGRHARLHDRIRFERVGERDGARAEEAEHDHTSTLVHDRHGVTWRRARLAP